MMSSMRDAGRRRARAVTSSPGASSAKPSTSNPHATFDTVAGAKAVTDPSRTSYLTCVRRVAKREVQESMARRDYAYRSRMVGIRYSRNARSKSYAGSKPQSARAAESSTSAGHESTMPCRFSSTLYVIDALRKRREHHVADLGGRRAERA